jgi:hypothetical protein
MPDGKHIPASEFHTSVEVDKERVKQLVDELYEKHKNDPAWDNVFADLEKAGLLSPIVVVPKPS